MSAMPYYRAKPLMRAMAESYAEAYCKANNLSVEKEESVEVSFAECRAQKVTASILHNEMHAYNTFEDPDKVKEEKFKDFTVENGKLCFKIPACSVIQFRVQ